MRGRWLGAAAMLLHAAGAGAQNGAVSAARVSVIVAEEQRAPTPRDVSTIRNAIRSRDGETARLAIRAYGRLERPALIPDLIPALRFALPELRVEAANALGQAARGWGAAGGGSSGSSGAVTPASVLDTLIERLELDDEPGVRAAICQTIGRLPYRTSDEVARAEAALVDHASRSDSVADRLGLAKGLEALFRFTRAQRPPGEQAVALARALLGVPDDRSVHEAVQQTGGAAPSASPLKLGPSFSPATTDPLRDARVRRLAFEALISAEAVTDDIVARTVQDADAQVRRLAMRAAGITGRGAASLPRGLGDLAPIVRLEALRAVRARGGDRACDVSIDSTTDVEPQIALLALDQLAACGSSTEAVAVLERAAADRPQAGSARTWHTSAHAIVALAAAAPDRAAAALGAFVGSHVWHLRMYSARAAATMRDRAVLETLSRDPHPNVAEAAIAGLSRAAGRAADQTFISALASDSYPVLRAAAVALDGTSDGAAAKPALAAALQRLISEGRANSLDTRAAIEATLTKLGAPPPAARRPAIDAPAITAENLRRFAAPRARVVIRDVGAFELALFGTEAPATVVRFSELAESGYYNGLSFHRVVPNFVIQGGSPAANEYVGLADHMRDEVGLWPHVRGTVGISTRGRDTGDGQIFINLVDNPRLDHEYTVFAQVLNGIEVVDRILEGDVIERIEIIP